MRCGMGTVCGSSRVMLQHVTTFMIKFEEEHMLWNYNIARNVNSSFSFVTIRRAAIRFFELGVVKHFIQKF